MQNSHYLPTIFIGNLIGDRFVLDCILSQPVRSPPLFAGGPSKSPRFRAHSRGMAQPPCLRSGEETAISASCLRGHFSASRFSRKLITLYL